MDKEERKDGKEKKKENESTNKKVKKKLHASGLDERFLSQVKNFPLLRLA